MLYKAVGEELEEMENAEAVPNLVLAGACHDSRGSGGGGADGRGEELEEIENAEVVPNLVLAGACHDRGDRSVEGTGEEL